MISGVFPADLKPRFKLCNDGPAPQCISGNVMGPKLHERQAYRFSYQNVGRQLYRQINDIATTLAARIWVQGGKVMGFVACCDWTHKRNAGLWVQSAAAAAAGVATV
jgi:hypothetical protein